MSEKVLKLINHNPHITTITLAKEFDKSQRTIERAIKSLKTENKIERVGGDNGGYWKLIVSI